MAGLDLCLTLVAQLGYSVLQPLPPGFTSCTGNDKCSFTKERESLGEFNGRSLENNFLDALVQVFMAILGVCGYLVVV